MGAKKLPAFETKRTVTQKTVVPTLELSYPRSGVGTVLLPLRGARKLVQGSYSRPVLNRRGPKSRIHFHLIASRRPELL